MEMIADVLAELPAKEAHTFAASANTCRPNSTHFVFDEVIGVGLVMTDTNVI